MAITLVGVVIDNNGTQQTILIPPGPPGPPGPQGPPGPASNPTPKPPVDGGVIEIPITPLDGSAPVTPASWKGPFAAVNPPGPGQVPMVYVDALHGTPDGSNGAWRDLSFLAHNTISLHDGVHYYPLLQDGGTIRVLGGGKVDAGQYHASYADFPGGVNIFGITAADGSRATFGPNSNAPMGRGLTWWPCSVYVDNVDFEDNGADAASGGYAGLRFGTESADTSGKAKHVHMTRCRANNCEDGVFGGDLNWSLLMEEMDFGDYLPNGVCTDYLSHDFYALCPVIVRRSNFYGCKYGANLKTRGPYLLVDSCFVRRGVNKWLDLPDGGIFICRNSVFTEMPVSSYAADPIVHSETDLHCMSMHNGTGQFDPKIARSADIRNCDVWLSRLANISNGVLSGEDFLVGDLTTFQDGSVQYVFSGCRPHWSNVNGVTPKIISFPDAGLKGLDRVPPAGTAFEALPVSPARSSGATYPAKRD